jgi:hypothetical protein
MLEQVPDLGIDLERVLLVEQRPGRAPSTQPMYYKRLHRSDNAPSRDSVRLGTSGDPIAAASPARPAANTFQARIQLRQPAVATAATAATPPPGSSSTPITALRAPPGRSAPMPVAGHPQSMGTVGYGFKREVTEGEAFTTRADARKEIFAWLNWR